MREQVKVPGEGRVKAHTKAPRIYRLLSPKYRKSNTDTSHLNTDPAPPKYRQLPIPSGHHRDDIPGLRPQFSLGPGLGRSRAPMAGHNPTPSRVRGHPPTPQAPGRWRGSQSGHQPEDNTPPYRVLHLQESSAKRHGQSHMQKPGEQCSAI